MAFSGGWCTIESGPGMFTNSVESFSVRGAKFSKLYSLNNYSLHYLISNYGDVYGLVFLFEWQASANDNSGDNNNMGEPTKSGGGGSGAEESPMRNRY